MRWSVRTWIVAVCSFAMLIGGMPVGSDRAATAASAGSVLVPMWCFGDPTLVAGGGTEPTDAKYAVTWFPLVRP